MTEPSDFPRAEYLPRSPDVDRPNSARLYDYFLGGTNYTAADRAAGDEIARHAPHWVLGARLNQTFVRCAVEMMAEAGIDQFLDLGSGFPTGANVHEIARAINPGSRAVYVENEPVAYEMARHMLSGDPGATVIDIDLRDPEAVLAHSRTQHLIDFDRPVGLLAVGGMLFVSDEDDPAGMLLRYRRSLVPGSYIAISAVTDDSPDVEVAAEVEWVRDVYSNAGEQVHVRTREQVAGWLDGTEIVEPGLVRFGRWRPEYLLTPEQLRCSHGYVGAGLVV